MTERQIERCFCEAVKKCGGLTYKFVSPGCAGVPDRIVITPTGKVWFVELKNALGVLSKIQNHRIHELEEQGANVTIVFGQVGAEKFVREVFRDEI